MQELVFEAGFDSGDYLGGRKTQKVSYHMVLKSGHKVGVSKVIRFRDEGDVGLEAHQKITHALVQYILKDSVSITGAAQHLLQEFLPSFENVFRLLVLVGLFHVVVLPEPFFQEDT